MQFQMLDPVATISQSGSFVCQLQTQLALLTWRQLAVTLHLPASSVGPGQVHIAALCFAWWLCDWYSSNSSKTVQVLRRRPRGWCWMVRSAGKELVLVPDLHKIRIPFLRYSPRGPTQDCLVVDTSHACRTFRREPHHMAKKSLQLSPCSRWSLVPQHSGMRCRVLHLSFGAQGVSKGETPWTFLERCPWARPRKSSGTTGGRDGSTTRTQSNGRIRPSRL